jgi:hypothetical protein
LEKAYSSLRLARTHWPQKAKADREALEEKLRELFRAIVDYTNTETGPERAEAISVMADFGKDDKYGNEVSDLVEKLAQEYRKILKK